MNRFALVAFVLVLLSIAGSAVWYLVHSREQVIGPLSAATTTPQLTVGDSIYTNGTYGFALMYPEGTVVENEFSMFYHVGNQWRVNGDQATGTPIVSFTTYSTKSEDSYPRYYSAMVRVGASTDKKALAACEKVGESMGETALPDVTIQGRVWKAFAFESAGMQQYVKGVSYRTVQEGRCIALEKMAAGSSYREDAPTDHDVSEETLAAAYASLDPIVSSFSFARP